jgi:hypothetical protein
LVGGAAFESCDRLPIEIGICPVCGSGIHTSRGIGRVNPLKLWGPHDSAHYDKASGILETCRDPKTCYVCYPSDAMAFLMFVGEKFYTVQEFMQESRTMGVSKRIPAVPDGLVCGETVVYLAHRKTILTDKKDESGNFIWLPGIFTAFVPQRVEKICWQSDYTPDNIDLHKKRGIDLVPVPDGDPDHMPSKKRVRQTPLI